jgi:tetratricopeptide (TPR) repeat protein
MGTDRILDIIHKKVTSTKLQVTSYKNSELRTPKVILCLLLTVYCLLFFAGCTIPRIIVLDDPLSPEEHLNLGVAYEKKGEWDNALKEYKAASKRLPVAYLYMGNIYFQKKEFDEAEFYYKKAIKKDPKNADVYNNLAWLYYTKRENLDEAEPLALKAIELNPSKKDIYQDTLEKIRTLRNPGPENSP